MTKKIAVLVSGGGTNLQALIDAQHRGEIVNGVSNAFSFLVYFTIIISPP